MELREITVKRKSIEPSAGRHSSDASRREQELCMAALASGEYDNMTDAEWVTMCEQIAHEGNGEADSQDDPAKDVVSEPGAERKSQPRGLAHKR